MLMVNILAITNGCLPYNVHNPYQYVWTNFGKFLPDKYGNVFINWKTGCQSREPGKELGWLFQLVLVRNIDVACPAY